MSGYRPGELRVLACIAVAPNGERVQMENRQRIAHDQAVQWQRIGDGTVYPLRNHVAAQRPVLGGELHLKAVFSAGHEFNWMIVAEKNLVCFRSNRWRDSRAETGIGKIIKFDKISRAEIGVHPGSAKELRIKSI